MTGKAAGEQFAGRLRELKERSGQSFGSLAKQLHVSTSTLHRYCSGAVVPADYAPVERLARLCGASAEELVELHRLWIRADALRAAAAGRPALVPAPAPVPVPAPEREPDGAPPPNPGRRSGRWPLVTGLAALLVVIVTAMNAATSDGSAGPPPAVEPTELPPPLSFTARSHVWQDNCAHRYLIDRPPGEVPEPPVVQDARRWADQLGAVHGDSTIVEATVTTTSPDPVVVEAVHIRVAERRAPLDWPSFDMSPGCGGALTPAAFTVDLDAERPLARPKDGFDGETLTELTPPALPFAITAEEPLALRVEAATRSCDCSWYIELEWSSGERDDTLVVDDGGEPFRTSGGGSGTPYGFAYETESWRAG
ncbi:helix-turn-helix domain-containing protein [Streptomyces litchfieldiae]|uniref:Helix-turn-helix transcriptional regulator n=1 Tax=Streptomyces litchfieldiae TaxID=3075543 RepID=A0ABU2MV15_9ACTN|nr:helix-turn-helix transcriptional regulator [Streptomyces sp. DSM 44938]MDT0345491.1 helix-turn-helix transcriptional regulator [Streptomyces sp. DSM 44938]